MCVSHLKLLKNVSPKERSEESLKAKIEIIAGTL